MSYLLDCNVLSELRKGVRANPGVRARFADVTDSDLFVSVIALGEIRRGVELVGRRDPRSATHLHAWLAQLVARHRDRILGVDARVADTWGRINVPGLLPAADGLQAATALVHGLCVVTRNVADFERAGCRLLDPVS